jgi:hypothetical protein
MTISDLFPQQSQWSPGLRDKESVPVVPISIIPMSLIFGEKPRTTVGAMDSEPDPAP